MIKKILEISLNRISAAFGLGGLSDYNTDKGLVIIYYCYKCIGFFWMKDRLAWSPRISVHPFGDQRQIMLEQPQLQQSPQPEQSKATNNHHNHNL